MRRPPAGRPALTLIARLLLAFLLTACAGARAADRVEFTWPTPNPAWAEGRPIGDYLQQAGSGDPESGSYGGVRSGGAQFHEGIDIKCVARDRRGEPTDRRGTWCVSHRSSPPRLPRCWPPSRG